MRDKAFRRFQEAKKKKWAKYAGKEWYDKDPSPRQIGLLAHTPKACSCWMCGNQRKSFGETFQEIKFKKKLKYDLIECDEF